MFAVLDDDEYALCGSRFAKVGCTIGENLIGNCSNVQMLRRLRGGAGVHLDIPVQWECKVCGATRCWPARKRCYRCDAPRDTVPNNLPVGPLGRPHSHAVLVLLLVALVLVIFHHGIPVLVVDPLRGPVLVLALVALRLRKRLKQVNCCRL